MAGYVTVVTDSTACLPTDLAARWGISIVQQQLHVGDHLDDEARIAPQTLLNAFADGTPLATSPPDPGAFFWTYQDAVYRGASAVVSIHISGKLSKTTDMAKFGAADSRIPVHVVDAGTAGMSLGYAVLAAARIANAGGNVEAVIGAASRRTAQSVELIHVETLEYLRRGGRIGAAAHLIGTALSVKPLLTVQHGEIVPLARTIGTERALRKLVDTAVDRAGNAPVDIAVEHFGAEKRAQRVLAQLRERVPNLNQVNLVGVSAIIAVHVGPGGVGITISPAESVPAPARSWARSGSANAEADRWNGFGRPGQ
jgi:DegV family protein with EDD domain